MSEAAGATADTADPAAPAGAERPPLDDVMLAMDVVDTLRRRERLVARELDELGRAEDLKQRLRRIYAQQGLDVPDHVIEQGVAALREDRFTYKPVTEGMGRRLALIYIERDRWLKWISGGFAAIVAAAAINWFAFIAPDRALPEKIAALHAAASAVVIAEPARAELDDLHARAQSALAEDDADAARAALEGIEGLNARLRQAYVLQIVNRPGQPSGVWRVPDVNQTARNYYVVVEAIGPDGEAVTVEIENEETGRTEAVTSWGLRVDEATFEAVKRDKQDDGIIERDRVGSKPRGHLEPSYEIPTTGGAITRW
ncbi:MAG: DUF6384 family protein [Chromatiaceae bacterium]|jgi:hypothetical protein